MRLEFQFLREAVREEGRRCGGLGGFQQPHVETASAASAADRDEARDRPGTAPVVPNPLPSASGIAASGTESTPIAQDGLGPSDELQRFAFGASQSKASAR
jgi:hypothetical protein